MKILKYLTLLCFIILGVFILLVLRPIPTPSSAEECLSHKGTVFRIYETGVKDVVFVLKESKQRFYINRGLENGLRLDDLQKKLLNKVITIKYPDYWTPLDSGKSLRHISKLDFEEEVIYSEIK